ncbi:hypothetical protein A0H81_12529 [Grifola frondosa]|uniref:Transcriptional repressor Tup1 N-terminal domain-containing protein n=1 Tax=Grifola frondosa TaxID=5627 RepID=A0A1C7LS86_GRIFR|nr:hypothetical protein A0H81_12529 [Grifola frondosa]
MSSSIYNHKHLQPTGAATQGPSLQQHHARLNDCFDTIRQEFDVVAQELNLIRGQRDEFENKVTGQVNELNIIRQSLYELETQHGKSVSSTKTRSAPSVKRITLSANKGASPSALPP